MTKKVSISRKARVMKTALEMVANGGFHSTPMAELAAQSGVAVGTIYHHFKSKDDLILALYHHAVDLLGDAGAKVLLTKNDEDAFARLWLGLLDHHLRHQNEFFFLEQFKHSPFVEAAGLVTEHKALEAVLKYFKELAKAKKIVKMDAGLVLEFFLCSVATAAHAHLRGGKHKLSTADRNAIVNMVWSALKV